MKNHIHGLIFETVKKAPRKKRFAFALRTLLSSFLLTSMAAGCDGDVASEKSHGTLSMQLRAKGTSGADYQLSGTFHVVGANTDIEIESEDNSIFKK